MRRRSSTTLPSGLDSTNTTERGLCPRDGRRRPSLHLRLALPSLDSRGGCLYVSPLFIPRLLVFAGLFWRQVAGLADLVDVQALRLEFGDLAAAAGGDGDVEDVRLHHAASGAFVQGEEAAACFPIPALEVVDVIDTDFRFQLRLSPESRTIRWDFDRGVEARQLVFPVFTDQLDPGLVVGVFAEEILGEEFEAYALGAGHFVFALKNHPFAAGADAIFFIWIGAHGAALRESQRSTEKNNTGQNCLVRSARSVHSALQTDIRII